MEGGVLAATDTTSWKTVQGHTVTPPAFLQKKGRLFRQQPPLPVPVLDGFLRIAVEMPLLRRRLRDRAPGGFGAEHQVDALRRRRQFGVDGRGERMDQLSADDYLNVVVGGAASHVEVKSNKERDEQAATAHGLVRGTISDHVTYFSNYKGAGQLKTVLTLRVRRSDAMLLAQGRIDEEEFRRRAVVHQY